MSIQPFDFNETDSAKIYNTVMSWLMDSVNEPLYPGDERRIYGEALAFVLTAVYNEMNDTAKQRTLKYARGNVLDAIGERVGAERLKPSSAFDVFRFEVSAAQPHNIIINKGTRITPDGVAYFTTDNVAVIQAGELSVDVAGSCTEGGSKYNGFAPGTIKTIVDTMPYVPTVSNLNGTKGGDDGEPYDETGDAKFRDRIRMASAAFSTAGPESAYRYFALTADPDIIDVNIKMPSANVVELYPLMTGGGLPDEETINKVLAVFADDVRPMTDQVNAYAPTYDDYDIEVKYYCTAEKEVDAVDLMESDGGAVDQYNAWQTVALGRDINPDQLRRFALQPVDGEIVVSRIDIIKPEFKALTRDKVAKYTGNLTISHAVVEE